MAGYIILNDDKDMGTMRENMRRTYMRHEGTMPMMRHHDGEKSWEEGYRMGYKHATEDWEDEQYRRRRDSMGRYV